MPYADPEKRREYARRWMRQKRAGLTEGQRAGGLLVPLDLRLRTADEVVALVREAVQMVRADDSAKGVEKGRALAYIASVALRVLEAGALEERVAALERLFEEAGRASA